MAAVEKGMKKWMKRKLRLIAERYKARKQQEQAARSAQMLQQQHTLSDQCYGISV